ncbi:MAG: hypothetical protein ACYDHH_29710 [Solirubrobacteraceae bacterium]
MATADSYPPPESARESFSLTPRQESLREALAAQSAEAARLYVGGLRVLADQDNPTSLRLASTAMRELTDELAVARGVVDLRGGSVKSRINNLRERVNGLSALLRVPTPSAQHVAKMLDHLDEFFRREEQINPSRKKKARLVVAAISVSAESPDLVAGPQADRLLELSGAFSAMLHGSSRSRFEQVLADFESLLLDLLTPDTFEDYATIDELISKGPPRA